MVKNRTYRAAASAVALAFILTACRSAAVRHEEPAPAPPAPSVQETPAPDYTAADVLFMQQMIPHHAQALEMTALVAERTDNRDIHLMAQRIEVSQNDEIAMMRQWLTAHGEEAAHPHAGHALMPGMLTPEEMAGLENARGSEFDRLFLELMIGHHEGALVMVRDLFATRGAAENSEIFRFASDVDADQRAEIRRMQSVLSALGN